MNDELPAAAPVHTPPPQHEMPKHHNEHRSGLKNIASTLAILIIAPLVALLITSFLFQSYEVFGPSMESTLHDGDRLIVVKAPRTWAKIRNKTFMPMRGQIVVFTKLDLFLAGEHGGNKQLIKRVIGLPGERIVVKEGVLTVYNKEHPDGYQPDKEQAYGKVIQKTGIDVDVTVGDDEVFVCGDNRDNSLDSRTFGPIKTKDIVGTAAFRFLPTNQARSL